MDDEIRKNPAASLRNAVNAWNRSVDHIPEWPQTRLKGAAPKARTIKLPLATFPASFAADLACFKETTGRTDFLAEPGTRPLAPASIATYARLLERFAGAVVRSGVPAEDIPDIAALLSDKMLEVGLRWLYARSGTALTPGLKQTILALQQVGRRHLGRAEQPVLDKYVKRLPRKQQGMTEKNRARLRPMLAPQMRARIAKLPEALMKRAGTQTSHKACLLREQAIALEILLYCPIRRRNLRSIDLDRHLQRPGDGRAYLVLPQDEVKNRKMLEFELPKRIVAMIERHLALRSPRLCPAGTTYLFPKRDGSGPMADGQLAASLKKCLRRELGLDVNLHLFRHFAAHLLLEACPGHYEAARRLLGHSRLTSTLNAYTGVETTSARPPLPRARMRILSGSCSNDPDRSHSVPC
ncbi:site-specific integrase [Salipiger bermudensis]|uniref:site-specific integrase n=1 Tax=Salipiger bermudensis TaxID=344736 RepID=UPI001A8EC202|nr:site-specific integrase [Salipiger bermudensis]MBN9678846.1 site-specific integrase [Salipiger bermudensis]